MYDLLTKFDRKNAAVVKRTAQIQKENDAFAELKRIAAEKATKEAKDKIAKGLAKPVDKDGTKTTVPKTDPRLGVQADPCKDKKSSEAATPTAKRRAGGLEIKISIGQECISNTVKVVAFVNITTLLAYYF